MKVLEPKDGNVMGHDLSVLHSCRHLENNNLTGALPQYFGSLPSLQELYVPMPIVNE